MRRIGLFAALATSVVVTGAGCNELIGNRDVRLWTGDGGADASAEQNAMEGGLPLTGADASAAEGGREGGPSQEAEASVEMDAATAAADGAPRPSDAGTDAPNSADGPPVIATELIDDMEATGAPVGYIDGINAGNPRVGTWFVFDDGTPGGLLTPMPNTAASLVIAAIPGGRGSSLHAARVTGNAGFTSYGAGMGFNLNAPSSPPGVYDASAYQGFTFWARSLGDSGTVTVRFNVLDQNTTPPGSGGICDGGACNGAYGMNLSLGSEWQQYIVYYDQLARPAFSVPDGVNFDPAHMIGCEWQVYQGQAFDLWVDDIYFIK